MDGESGLHASVDMIRHVTVQQPGSGRAGHHLDSLENPGEELEDVSTVHSVCLQNNQKEPKNNLGNMKLAT